MSWNTPLEQWWADRARDLMLEPCNAYVQIRKMHTNLKLELPAEIFNTGIDMGYSMMGYGNDKSKGTQLKRNYFNEEELTKAREKFKERIAAKGHKRVQSCISAQMGSEKKKGDTQGFCMQTITINYIAKDLKRDGKPSLYIDLYYRTTEFIQKFLADLKFLHDEVIPFILDGIDIPLTGIRFLFSTAYVSLMYFPVWYRNESMLKQLKQLEKVDPKFWKMCLGAGERLLVVGTNYNYQTRRKQHEYFHKHSVPNISLKELKILNKYITIKRASLK